MSSESEDDFQSADEGSEDDDPIHSVITNQTHHQNHDEEKAAAVDDNDDDTDTSIKSNSQPKNKLQEESNTDGTVTRDRYLVSKSSHDKESHEKRELSPSKNEVDNVEDQNKDNDKIKSKVETSKHKETDEPSKDEVDNFTDFQNSKEKDKIKESKLDVSKHTETDDKSKVIDTGSEDCITPLHDLKIGDEIKHHEANTEEQEQVTSNNIQEKTKRKQKFAAEKCDIKAENKIQEKREQVTEKCKIEAEKISEKREQVTEKCDVEAENIPKKKEQVKEKCDTEVETKSKKSEERKTEGSTDTVKKNSNSDVSTKRPRESRIGMKKPREKLGAKRLGSKLEKKPLEGLGSDDIIPIPQESNINTKSTDHTSEKNKEEERRKEKQLEEERWQRIHRQEQRDDGGGWGGGWGGWGNSLMSAASTFTREVGRGVGTVMETVESGLGVPDPETMAREAIEKKKEKEEHIANDPSAPTSDNPSTNQTEEKGKLEGTGQGGLGGMWLGSWVSGVSGALETASNKVLLGGLDTLEVIGRKAMDAIQDGDPGLRNKRAFLTNNKPNLSQVLQDARTRAAEEERGGGVYDAGGPRGVTLEAAWDQTEGGVHLEALSLVARQCETKYASMIAKLPHYILNSLATSNSEIKSACEVGEEGDMESSLEGDLNEHIAAIITDTALPLNISRLSKAWSEMQKFEDSAALEEGIVDEGELYRGVVEVVAQVAALSHKAAEMALTMPEVDPLTLSTNFRQLSCSVWGSVEGLTDRICGSITSSASTSDAQVNDIITNIYLQVSHGSKYIQQSMGYLSPILQYVNTKRAAADL